MTTNTQLPIKKFYIILVSCSVIIFLSSLDVMITVKDENLFREWIKSNQLQGLETDLMSTYVAISLSQYFSKIAIPITFAIYSYFALIKIKINQLFVFMWTVLNLGGMAYNLVELKLDSIFYYIIAFAYIIIILTLISLIDEIRESKSK